RIVLVSQESPGCTIKAVQPSTVGSQPKCAGGVFANSSHLVIRKAVSVLGVMPVESESSTFSIHLVETTLGAHPKKSLAVALACSNHTAIQAVRITRAVLIVDKRESSSWETAQSASCSYPHYSFPVFKQRVDPIVRQALWIRRVCAVPTEL